MALPSKKTRKTRTPMMRAPRGMAPAEPAPAAPAIHRPDQPDTSTGSRDMVSMIVNRLDVLRDEQVQRKLLIEERWLADLRGFHGRYASNIEAQLVTLKQSRLFINQTRAKTNSWTARIGDLMFPIDAENFSIAPTPVPVLTRDARMSIEDAKELAGDATRALAAGDQVGAEQAAGAAKQAAVKAREARKQMKLAKRRADGMFREVKDQLVECEYNIRSRQVIRDACRVGTGIMKGPMAKHRVRRGWRMQQGADDAYQLAMVADPRPEFLRVDPWAFFPDMNACRGPEMEFSFERHLPNARELRNWADIPGMNREAIGDMLRGQRFEVVPHYLVMLREITGGGGQAAVEKRFVAWEYHGDLTPDEAAILARVKGDKELLAEVESDVLERYQAIVFFSNADVLKWSPHPMDSGEPLYSVFNFEEDEASLFGFGVPYLMRDSQAAMNGAWRMIMDNAGLSVGPQIIIDKDRIEPQDGTWDIYAKKIWLYSGANAGPNSPDPFTTKDIPIRQGELEKIITLARQFSDDETSMPPIAYGESASHVTRTAQGMAILMNSVNVTFRRVVKNFDDQLTTPNIRRIYDWNMQFSPNKEIKGDFDVKASGSSVLLVRELEAQNLMQIANAFASHPVFGPMTKAPDLYRKLIASHMIQPDEIVKTDDELEAEAAKAAEDKKNGLIPKSPEEQKLETQLKIADLETKRHLAIAQLNHETEMMKLAQTMNVSIGKINADLKKSRMKIDSDERILATEAAVAQRSGIHAGGKV